MAIIHVAAWHVISESGDDYSGMIAMKERNMNTVFLDVIEGCSGEVSANMDCSELNEEDLTPEEILEECLLDPEVDWLTIDTEDYN